MNRSIQVEGAFGVIKVDSGFRRFLMRGKNNVRTDFLLVSMGYNITKLHAKIQRMNVTSFFTERKSLDFWLKQRTAEFTAPKKQ
jgi:hypothetical protein